MCIPESVHIEPEQHLWFPLYSQFFQWEGSLQHQRKQTHRNCQTTQQELLMNLYSQIIVQLLDCDPFATNSPSCFRQQDTALDSVHPYKRPHPQGLPGFFSEQ